MYKKYVYEVINNNYNFPTYITRIWHEVHISYNAFIAYSALNSICVLYMLWA